MKIFYYICLLASMTLISCSRNFNLTNEDYDVLLRENTFKEIKRSVFVDSLAYDGKRYALIGDPLRYKFFYVPREYLTKDIKEKDLFQHGCPIVKFPHFVPGRNYYVTDYIHKPTVRFIGKKLNRQGWQELEFLVPPKVFKCYLIRGDEFMHSYNSSCDIGFGPYEFPDKQAYYRVIQPVWTEFRGKGQLEPSDWIERKSYE